MRETLKLLLTLFEEDRKHHEHYRTVDALVKEIDEKKRQLDKFAYPLWHDQPAEMEKHIPKDILTEVKKLRDELTEAQDRVCEAHGFVKGYELGLEKAIKRIERALYEEKDDLGIWERRRGR